MAARRILPSGWTMAVPLERLRPPRCGPLHRPRPLPPAWALAGCCTRPPRPLLPRQSLCNPVGGEAQFSALTFSSRSFVRPDYRRTDSPEYILSTNQSPSAENLPRTAERPRAHALVPRDGPIARTSAEEDHQPLVARPLSIDTRTRADSLARRARSPAWCLTVAPV
jgi:hypothetical protein